MYLIDPADLILAIGGGRNASGGGSLDTEMVKTILGLLTPKMETMLNVESISRLDCIDTFNIPAVRPGAPISPVILRLSNSFVIKSSVVIKDAFGTVLDYPSMTVNEKEGTISLPYYFAGEHRVAYTSGFDVPAAEGEEPIFQNVPAALRAVVVQNFTFWARTTLLANKLPNAVSLTAALNPLVGAINSGLYGYMQRPRATCLWSDAYEVVVATP